MSGGMATVAGNATTPDVIPVGGASFVVQT